MRIATSKLLILPHIICLAQGTNFRSPSRQTKCLDSNSSSTNRGGSCVLARCSRHLQECSVFVALLSSCIRLQDARCLPPICQRGRHTTHHPWVSCCLILSRLLPVYHYGRPMKSSSMA
ncbi:hypothetical protein C8Q70DRAFT_72780 [Cubamyces menziesii]|nr:hypothetical protein C8Q70DRAFT_72780 [Cubamyces menziesii]